MTGMVLLLLDTGANNSTSIEMHSASSMMLNLTLELQDNYCIIAHTQKHFKTHLKRAEYPPGKEVTTKVTPNIYIAMRLVYCFT